MTVPLIRPPRRLLPVLAAAQLAGTALWFAPNAVLAELGRDWNVGPTALGHVTTAVQLGFIVGTLLFGGLRLADRWSPRWLFLCSACAGAAATAGVTLLDGQFRALLVLRFLTGMSLAGVYPVGMRIAADWFRDGLGHALGILVGALVLGTATPHAVRALGASLDWRGVLLVVAGVAVAGGISLLVSVPEHPQHLPGRIIELRALRPMMTHRGLRSSILGYFGHMWELYAFWMLVPLIVASRMGTAASGLSALVIGVGAVGCVVGGRAALRFSGARVATVQLGISAACALASPVMLQAPVAVFVAWLLIWGVTVVGDSPQFSALTAQLSPREVVGSVLTLTTAFGFAVSIVSIQLASLYVTPATLRHALPLLAAGPLLGLLAMRTFRVTAP